MNTDPRGVKRGNCLSEDCDCSSYEYEENSGPKCHYCLCPPTKHQKLGNYSLSADKLHSIDVFCLIWYKY